MVSCNPPYAFDRLDAALALAGIGAAALGCPLPAAVAATGASLAAKRILHSSSPPVLKEPTAAPPQQKEPLSCSFWKYLGAALLAAAVAAALFFVCPPLGIALAALSGWLLCTAILMLLNHWSQDSETDLAKGIRWTHAMVLECNSAVLAGLLFPATLFPSYHKPTGIPDGRPILMVNGYLSFGSTWHFMRKRLAEAGHGPIYTMNIGSFDSISKYAAEVQAQVKRIQEETGRSDIAFVCHSKGGLVASHYATRMAEEDGIEVTDVITIGSPLAGTPIAKLGLGKDARQMEPNHRFNEKLRDHIAKKPEIRFFHIASETDEVVPLNSAILGANPKRQKIFKDVGHLGLVFSSKAADQVDAWLRDC